MDNKIENAEGYRPNFLLWDFVGIRLSREFTSNSIRGVLHSSLKFVFVSGLDDC